MPTSILAKRVTVKRVLRGIPWKRVTLKVARRIILLASRNSRILHNGVEDYTVDKTTVVCKR